MSMLRETEAKKRRAKTAATTATPFQIWADGLVAFEYRASAVVLLQRETMTDLLVTEDGIDVTQTMPRLHRIEAMRELLAEAHEQRAADLRSGTFVLFRRDAYTPRAMLQADTCATPDCLETENLKQDGDGAYCPGHR